MTIDGLNYNKTVETNKIVFEGFSFWKTFDYILLLFFIPSILVVDYSIFTAQLENNPTKLDYFVAIFFPILLTGASGLLIKTILTRDKLKEFDTNYNIKKRSSKERLLNAAKNLNWEHYLIEDNYLIFKTGYNWATNRQIVTLIFFPDNRILFNSIDNSSPNGIKTRFDDNYKELKAEYNKIKEK